MLVSVVIPTFERPDYLERAVVSVAKQTYKKIEIIIVIDGKSDITKQKVSEIKKKHDIKITLIETDIKVGGSEARNIGVNNSLGDYVAFLDDDDEWLKDKLEVQLDLISKKGLKNSDMFLCFTSAYVYNNKKNNKYTVLPRVNYDKSTKKNIANYLFEPNIIYLDGFIQTSTILLPKTLAQLIPFKKGLPKHQDWDLLVNLSEIEGLIVLQVEEPKSIYHTDVPKSVARTNKWRFSENWINERKKDVSEKAYFAFMYKTVFLGIVSDNNLSIKDKQMEIRNRKKKFPFKYKFNIYGIVYSIVIYIRMYRLSRRNRK